MEDSERFALVRIINEIQEKQLDIELRLARVEAKCSGLRGTGTRSKVADLIARHFSSDEIDGLAFDLDLNGDYVEVDTKAGKARELVLACDRRSLMDDLLHVCKEKRPRASWPLV